MHDVIDPILPVTVSLAFAILSLALVLKLLNQPSVIAYILAGLLIGPSGLEIIESDELVSRLGSIGVVLLLFFIGMEVNLKQLIANWKVMVLGTLAQTILSVGCIYLMGWYLVWPIERIVLLGFVITLSSTAVVLKLLQDRNELTTHVGQNVMGILLVQDVLIVPMLIILSAMSGTGFSWSHFVIQVTGGIIIVGLVYAAYKKGTFKLPFADRIEKDHELQVFYAMITCLGFAWITAMLGLSTALGAFVAGMLIASAASTRWIHDALHSFRTVFVALFFVSVGLLIDLRFLQENWITILILVFLALILNTLINMFIFRMSNMSWKESLYGASLLAQIGEFSFVIAAVGLSLQIISAFAFKTTVLVVALNLLLSPIWIALFRKITADSGDLVLSTPIGRGE